MILCFSLNVTSVKDELFMQVMSLYKVFSFLKLKKNIIKRLAVQWRINYKVGIILFWVVCMSNVGFTDLLREIGKFKIHSLMVHVILII